MTESSVEQPLTVEAERAITPLAGLAIAPCGNRTTDILQLLDAFTKAQAEMKPAEMDQESGAFQRIYRYASLSSILKSAKPALTKHGLSVMQEIEGEAPKAVLVTTLYHTSGQWRRGRVPMFLDKLTSHGLGAAITYARRYGLSMLVGIETDGDDDAHGAEAEQTGGGKKTGQRPPATGKPPVQPKGAETPYQKTPEQLAAPATLKQKQMIYGIVTKELGLDEEGARAFFERTTKKPSAKEWLGADIDLLMKEIPEEKKRNSRAAEQPSREPGDESESGEFGRFNG